LSQNPTVLFDADQIRHQAKPGELAISNTDPIFLVIQSKNREHTASANRTVDDWRRSQTDLPSRAEAIRRMVELAATMTTALRIEEVEADRTGLRALGADSMADCLFGILRHQSFSSAFEHS
jgi:hypothetical protein